MKERKYRNPPVVEVVCEFRFKPTPEWDATVPGLIYERLKESFPKRRPLRNVGMHVHVDREALSLQSQTEEGMQFLREDERAFVQLHPRRISIHHLAPYPHWETFKPLIQEAYRAYLDVLPHSSLQRIGLRYINQINFSSAEVELGTYLNVYPFVASQLPQRYAAFNLQLLFVFEEERDGLQLRLSNAQPANGNAASILLDLDYFLLQPEKVDATQALDWVEQAHQNILEVFEGTITDQLRQQFEEEKK